MHYVSSGAEITTTKKEFGRVNSSEFRALPKENVVRRGLSSPCIKGCGTKYRRGSLTMYVVSGKD